MAKIQKVTGVKKAMGDYNRGTDGVILYHMGHRQVYYDELPSGQARFRMGPSVVLIGYKIGERTTGETMDTIKAKVTAHYLAKKELGMSNYNYAEGMNPNSSNTDDPRVVAYNKYLQILMVNIF